MSTLAYFDASVWVAYLLNENDRFFPFANSAIEKMDRKEIQVILNKLVMLETVHVLRVKTTRYETYDRPLDGKKVGEIKSKIDDKIKKFVDAITDWENEGKLFISDITTSVGDFMKNAFLNMYGYWGIIKESNKCGGCKQQLPHPQYYYDGLGQWDFQHAMLAKLDNASEFYSTDGDFKSLISNASFSSIKFIFPY